MNDLDRIDQEQAKIEELRESLNSFLDMMYNALDDFREQIISFAETSEGM